MSHHNFACAFHSEMFADKINVTIQCCY